MKRDDHSRESYGHVRALLARAAVKHPHAAFRAAAALGMLRQRVTRRWPTHDEVGALFPHLDRRAIAETSAQISALEERNRVLVRTIAAGGIEPVCAFTVAAESLAALEGPGILATFHVGALHAIGAVLGRLRSPVLAFRAGLLFTPTDSLQVESTEGDEQTRAAALHRALLHLRRGGLVALALDIVPDRGIETRCLSRPLCLAAGAFALAEWTEAPIVPLVARWTSRGVRIDTGNSLSGAQDAATWLERYLLASPSETSLGLLRTLLAAKLIPEDRVTDLAIAGARD